MPHHYADKYVHAPNEIPTGEHWAIIKGTSVFIPGDERSRTAPGHGYPERTENYIEYAAFTNEAKFLEALQYEYQSSRQYGGSKAIGIHVTDVYTEVVSVGVHKV